MIWGERSWCGDIDTIGTSGCGVNLVVGYSTASIHCVVVASLATLRSYNLAVMIGLSNRYFSWFNFHAVHISCCCFVSPSHRSFCKLPGYLIKIKHYYMMIMIASHACRSSTHTHVLVLVLIHVVLTFRASLEKVNGV